MGCEFDGMSFSVVEEEKMPVFDSFANALKTLGLGVWFADWGAGLSAGPFIG